jgi:transcription antitermination factor NusG
VLRLRSRFDFTVRDALRAAGVEEFLPTYSRTTRWSDRTNVTTRPLFSGYCFARFDAADKARVFVRGVVEILSIDQAPIPISDDVIEDLRRVVESPAPCSPCAYVVGERVRVKSGPFAGILAIVTRTQGETTLTLPIEILGRAVSVQIDTRDVARGGATS